MGLAGLCHRAWRLAGAGHARRFAAALPRAGDAQRARFAALARAAAGTAFGRAHGFAGASGADALRALIPMRSWEELAPWLARVAAGEADVLFPGRASRLVPTGGSSGGRKLVPWTRALAREFRAALGAWVADLDAAHPGCLDGCAYWSVTPLADDAPPRAGVPVGFEDDSAYVGGLLRPLVAAALAAPSCLRRIACVDAFRHATLRCLLARRDLSLISVWHPSFLVLLLDAARERRAQVLRDIADGGCSAPLPADVAAALAPWCRRDPRRAAELAEADWDDPRALWPRLRVVSCWADGPAAFPAAALAGRLRASASGGIALCGTALCGTALRGLALQPKGLLATEAAISIPWRGAAVLAVDSTVVEFIDGAGRARWCDEVEPGADYEIAITTGGGLWRYRIGDRVRVEGFTGRAPRLRFLGRGATVCDLVGEKLDEAFVAGCLATLLPAGAGFALLAPDPAEGPGYTLFCDADSAQLAVRLDEALSANPQWRLARRLGQLAPPRVFRVGHGAQAAVIAHRRAAGLRLGEIKPAALDADAGWSRRLPGAYVAQERG